MMRFFDDEEMLILTIKHMAFKVTRSLPEAEFDINVPDYVFLPAHLKRRRLVKLSDDVTDVQLSRAEDVVEQWRLLVIRHDLKLDVVGRMGIVTVYLE